MGIFSKIRSFLLNYRENEKIILKLKNEISNLNEENLKLRDKIINLDNDDIRNSDNSIFNLNRKINKLNEEIKSLKYEIEALKKGFKFNFFDREIEEEILKQLSLAKKEVHIVLAWLTSYKLIDKLEKLKNNGVYVNLIVDDNKDNDIKKLKIIANSFKEITVFKEDKKRCMHNKYCIIDDNIVIDGSYNWSKNAKNNEEHIIVVESEIVAKIYKGNFERLMKDYTNNISKLSA